MAGFSRQALWLDLGVDDYTRAYELQTRLHALRVAGRISDAFVLMEHPPCITVGRTARPEHILASRQQLRAAGIAFHTTDRGGGVTYHGPGQLVLYPIVDLGGYGRDVHAHARRLEQVLIDTVGAFGVTAVRRREYPGVWTAQGKIGAIGLRVTRWVTLHGVSLNVSPDLTHFSHIVPCGISGEGVVSLAGVLERQVEIAEVKKVMQSAVAQVFGTNLHSTRAQDIQAGRHPHVGVEPSGVVGRP